MAVNVYFQCHLKRGDTHMVAWVESRAAKEGASVEIKPTGDFWEVVEVYDTVGLPQDALKQLNLLHRHSLPSIDPIH